MHSAHAHLQMYTHALLHTQTHTQRNAGKRDIYTVVQEEESKAQIQISVDAQVGTHTQSYTMSYCKQLPAPLR